jgi:hypothetical protein
MRNRSFTVPAALVSAVLLLSACGSDSQLEGKPGPQVADLAADALEEAGAVHMQGTMKQDGDETEIDIQLQGDDAAGSISISGTEVELISVGGEVFVKATAELLTSFGLAAQDAARYEDAWIAVPADAAAEFADFTLAGFVEELRTPEDEIKKETRSDELDGESVVIVEQADGSTLTVKDDDPAYPLRLAGKKGEGSLAFTDHGKKRDISAPEGALTLEELVGS